jgi:antibiotic biosynthesis monooxygenase (ABM) superfamily enzyme
MVFHHHIDDDEEKANSNGPVTVNVKIKAKKGRIDEFEEWMHNIIHESLRFEGHMGVNIIRPSDASNPEYIVILRFDTYQNLAKWENSETQRIWFEKGKDLWEVEPRFAKQTGLEFWFTPFSRNAQAPAMQPPRYKMAIVTGVVIFALFITLLPLIENATAHLPFLVGVVITIVVIVVLMTYVIMPAVTWLLRPWLSKKRLF